MGTDTIAREETLPNLASSPLEDVSERISAIWNYRFLDSATVRLALFLAIAALCLVRAYIGLSGITVYSHDAFGALDGAWRVLNGQIPHADFYSPLGPLIYLTTALGLLLSRGGANGFGISQALCGAALTVWAYRLSRTRLNHLAVILFCLLVALISLNPSSVGEPPINTSCMPYNRYGYALVALLMLESIMPSASPATRTEFRGGVSTGALLATLLFLKISYFVGAAALLAALIPCRAQTRHRWSGIFSGFLIVFLIFCAYLRFNLLPMWIDFRMVGGAKPARISWFIVDNLYARVAFYLAFAFAAAAYLSSRAVRVAGVAVCLAGIFLLATNFQFYGLPLSAILAILILDRVSTQPAQTLSRSFQRAGLLAWGTLFVAGSMGYEAMGLGFGAAQKRSLETGPHASFESPVLAGFGTFERAYVETVNNGLDLLNRSRAPGDTVMSLDFSNPFSYALGMPPAFGGATTLHYRGNFNDAHHPAPDFLFGHASLVMMPLAPTEEGLRLSIPRIYGRYLADHFHPIAESNDWRLYRQN